MTFTELYNAIDNQIADLETSNDMIDIDFDVLDHDLDTDINQLIQENNANR